jgi:hypothetical protein
MNSFTRSYQLFKESFAVLKKDKEIMLFPIVSGIIGIVLFVIFIVPIFFTSAFGDFGSAVSYLMMFIYYVVGSFVVVFFNVGLVTCANIRMGGGDPKFRDGIDNAIKHIGKIFVWATISATVGIVLRNLSQRSGLIGKIVISLIGMAWGLLTYFVVPVMIFEEVSVIDSIKKSGALFKKTWGENVIGQASMGLFFFLLFLLGIVPIIIGVIFLMVMGAAWPIFLALLCLTFIYWIFLAILSASLSGIYMTALYNYATKGVVPAGYSEDFIKSAWKTKG